MMVDDDGCGDSHGGRSDDYDHGCRIVMVMMYFVEVVVIF